MNLKRFVVKHCGLVVPHIPESQKVVEVVHTQRGLRINTVTKGGRVRTYCAVRK